jgi:hypothetical protein
VPAPLAFRPLTLTLVSVLALSGALGGCDNPRTASAANLLRAAQTTPGWACAALPDQKTGEVIRPVYGARDPALDALADAGVLGLSADGYRLTATGKAAVGTNFLGVALCYAKRRATEVVTFTAPVPALGETVSQATVKYDLADVASWAKNDKVQAQIPAIREALANPGGHTETVTMVLGDKGWRVQPKPSEGRPDADAPPSDG